SLSQEPTNLSALFSKLLYKENAPTGIPFWNTISNRIKFIITRPSDAKESNVKTHFPFGFPSAKFPSHFLRLPKVVNTGFTVSLTLTVYFHLATSQIQAPSKLASLAAPFIR